LTTSPATITIAASKRADIADFHNLPYFHMLEENTGVQILWEIYDRDVGWPEQRGLMMTAGTYPEAFYGAAGFVATDMMTYGANGIFLPMNDLIARYGTNMIPILEKRPDIHSFITAPDGNIYHLPVVDETGLALGSSPFIHKEWLAETGLPMPTDAASLLNVMRAMKANGHENIFGFQDPHGNTGFLQWSGMFGVNIHSFAEYVVMDGKIEFGLATTAFRETMKWVHTIYAEGMMDVESLTQNRATFQAKSRSDPPMYGVFAAWSRSWMIGSEDHPNFALYELIPPMQSTEGTYLWNYQNAGIGRSGFIITDKCKDPSLAYKWIDYQAHPDLSIQAVGGPFGERQNLLNNGNVTANRPPEGMTDTDYIAQQCPGVSGFRIILAEDARRIIPNTNAAERNRNYDVYKEVFDFPLFTAPFYLSEEDSNRVDLIQVDLDAYVRETMGRWIVGGNIDREWNSYLQQLNTFGLQTILEIYNEVYSR